MQLQLRRKAARSRKRQITLGRLWLALLGRQHCLALAWFDTKQLSGDLATNEQVRGMHDLVRRREVLFEK